MMHRSANQEEPTLQKREQFAVSLRQNRKQKLLEQRRQNMYDNAMKHALIFGGGSDFLPEDSPSNPVYRGFYRKDSPAFLQICQDLFGTEGMNSLQLLKKARQGSEEVLLAAITKVRLDIQSVI
jgi:hypothetical protein